LPAAIVRRRKRHPPCEHATEKQRANAYFTPEPPNEYQRSHGCQRQESSYNLVRIAEWSIKPHSAKCPGNSNDGGEEDEQLTDPANDSHQIMHYERSKRSHLGARISEESNVMRR